jgi:FtsH-binding integral membrane protein
MLCALLAGIASFGLRSRFHSVKQQAALLSVATLVALIGVYWSSYSAWELYQAAQFPGPIQVSRPVPFGLSIFTYRAICAAIVLSPVAIIFARGRARGTTAIATAILAGAFSGRALFDPNASC